MARKMKDSGIEWIGEIPEGWETQKLKYYATVTSGEILSRDEYDFSGDIPVIGSNGKIGTTYKSNNHSEVITTGRVGTIGTAQIVQDAWITDNALIIKSHSINRPFLTYVIPNFDFKFMLSGTAQPLITATKLKNQYIPVPSSEVQDKLAQYLNTQIFNLSHLISQACSSIELYKKLKQAVITQAVTTLNSPNVKLKYLMDIIVDCPHETPIYTFTGNYLVIRTSDQSLASLRGDEYMYRLDEAEYKKRTRRLTLDKDDIVYGREGSWGLACLVPQSNKYCLGQRVMQFRCNTRLLYPKYAMYALNSETVYMQGALDTIGSTAPHVNISTICNYLLPVPALTEQKEVADYLDAKCAKIDGLIAKKEQLVKELEGYKKSLIYEVVTGKREV